MLVLGAIFFVEGLRFGPGQKDESIGRYVDESERLPSGTQRDLWMVGAFRKAAVILETRFALYKFAVLDMASGLILIFAGIFLTTFSLKRLNKGPEQMLLAKLLRTKWEDEIGKS